jgi:hypothetical protein
MAANTCYTMNPARGAAPSWINSNANDTWWWSIASCSGIQPKSTLVATTSFGPARYQVYDMRGNLYSSSAYQPQNLPRGRWVVVTRDAIGQVLGSRLMEKQ